jgi:hypothetical protein
MENLYAIARNVALYGTAMAGIMAGYRIYMRWQEGEPIQQALFTWLGGLITGVLVLYAIDTYIVGGSIMSMSMVSQQISITRQVYGAVMAMGVVVAVFGLIKLYRLHNSGEEVVDLIYRWVGSIFFLALLGYIIDSIMA